MTATRAFCPGCDTALRATDQFCPGCGPGADVPVRTPAPQLEDFQQPGGAVHRIGDFIVDHARGLLITTAIGALVAIGAVFGQEEPVPENASSPGYEMVRDLQSSGAIDDFTSITPEDGWESEYSLDGGDANIRFRGSEMEYEVVRYEEDLRNAIETTARDEGFTG